MGAHQAQVEGAPAGRGQVLAHYQRWLAERWRKGHLSLDDVRALKAFCRVHAVTPQEHEATAQGVGVDRRELVDENNQHFADWLLAQRRSLPRGGGGLRFAMPAGPAPWKLRLPEQPPAWQAALAWLAALVALASTIAAVAL